MPEQKTLREIDALVAEKVMGNVVGRLERQPLPEVEDDYTFYANTATGHTIGGLAWREGDLMEGDGNLSRYSSDISAAWEVVGKMCPLGRDVFSLKYEPIFPWRGSWTAEMNTKAGRFFEIGPTAPLAICLAALRAVGVDVEVKL